MIVPVLSLVAMLAGAGPGRAGDTLDAAKELYASAAYDDALAMLTRLSSTAPADAALQIEKYESFCLYALGRTADAENAVRDLIQHDPFFQLEGDDASPRVRAMFVDVRKQLLPQIAKDRYAAAKTEMDGKQYATAESHLADVLKIIVEARRLGVSDGALDDLATLADGFRELAAAAAAKAAAPPSPAAGVAAEANVAPTHAPARTIYDARDADVTPPVGIAQVVPPVPPELAFGLRDRKGVLALTVAADGDVEAATMREPFKSPYDQIVLSAAKHWRFKPAMKAGAPVPYVMTIELTYKSPE